MHTHHRITGHVRLVNRQRGPVFYARIRTVEMRDGKPVPAYRQRLIGKAWTKKGRPPEGWLTKQTANAALVAILEEEERNAANPMAATGVTFEQAAAEWLHYSEHSRQVRPSTLRDYAATVERLRAHFGATVLTEITAEDVETYKATITGRSARTVNRHLVILGGIFRRAERKWGIRHNPAAQVDRQREQYGGHINFLTPEEVQALVRATPDEQDAALYLVAALTGLRQGELLALTWADVDFGLQRVHVRRSYDQNSKRTYTPKSGKVRSVPMVDEVIGVLDTLSRRERFTAPDDLVFPDWTGEPQYHGDLRTRFYAALRRAGLKRIRFHDLRHTFGTLAIQKLPLRTVQEYMGHAHITTTMVYSHYAPAGDEAALLGQAFRTSAPQVAVPA